MGGGRHITARVIEYRRIGASVSSTTLREEFSESIERRRIDRSDRCPGGRSLGSRQAVSHSTASPDVIRHGGVVLSASTLPEPARAVTSVVSSHGAVTSAAMCIVQRSCILLSRSSALTPAAGSRDAGSFGTMLSAV